MYISMTDRRRLAEWRNELGIAVPSIDGERDGLDDSGLFDLLAGSQGFWRPRDLTLLPTLLSLQTQPATSTIALRELLAADYNGFSIEEPKEEAPTFLANAPRSWNDMEARACLQLAEARLANARRWERWERPFDEYRDYDAEPVDESVEEDFVFDAAGYVELDEGDVPEFDVSLGCDVDDSRWEQPGYVLDPNWSTCPAVVDQNEDLNDRRRWLQADGAQDILRNEYNRKAELQALGQHVDEILTLRLRRPARAHFALLREGICLAIDFEARCHAESAMANNAEQSAWKGHGRAAREQRFLLIARLFVRGQSDLLLRRPGARGFLSWLRCCWGRIETLNRDSYNKRAEAMRLGDTVMAMGRDYAYAKPHMDLLRAWRRGILQEWSWVPSVTTSTALGIAWISRKAQEALPAKRGASCGTRGWELNAQGSIAAPNLLADIVEVRTLGLDEAGTKLAYDFNGETVTRHFWRVLGRDHDVNGVEFTAIEPAVETYQTGCSNPRRIEREIPSRTPDFYPKRKT